MAPPELLLVVWRERHSDRAAPDDAFESFE
jgi:hypothetical protein